MRDLASIESMLPDLQNRLAFMYYELVERSKHQLYVGKSEYEKAESCLTAIELLIACDTDLEQINAFVNDFLKHIATCCLPVVCDPEYIELECQADATVPTLWIPDIIACQTTTTTTSTSTTTTTTIPIVLYNMLATITSFDTPDSLTVASNATQKEIILKAETGVNKQFFEIENAFPKTVNGVYTYNDSLSMYMPTNKLSEYTLSTPTGYQKYTYNGAKRGSTQIKITFV